MYRLISSVGRPADETLSLSRLIVRGVYEQFPQLKLVGCHLGGGICEVIGRLNYAYELGDFCFFLGSYEPLLISQAPGEYLKLMYELQVIAFQADLTRVATLMVGREGSLQSYPEIGVPDPHHPLSHHGNDPAKIERMSKINTFHVSLFAEFLGKLKATPEGNGTLLDHSLYLYGSGIGNPNIHDHTNLPILVAGGSATGLKGNRQTYNGSL